MKGIAPVDAGVTCRFCLSLICRHSALNPVSSVLLFSSNPRSVLLQMLLFLSLASPLRAQRHHRRGQLLRLQRHRHPAPLLG